MNMRYMREHAARLEHSSAAFVFSLSNTISDTQEISLITRGGSQFSGTKKRKERRRRLANVIILRAFTSSKERKKEKEKERK